MLLVLLFHADLGVPGGFVGVDVFFVISGYLMTALLLKEHDGTPPYLRDFYIRRIRRIVPAATAMVLVVLTVGFAILLPSEYSDLAKSAIAQQLMVSNIFFWRHTGYFDGAAELKPLLHTWSLAVEEQFYLVYPLLIALFLRKASRHRIRLTLVLLTLGSFLASLYGTWNHPSVTFYLLPTRAWELLIGGLICVMPPPRRLTPFISNVVATASAVGVLAVAVLIDKHTAFPGIAALVPCLATAVLIYIHRVNRSIVGAILAFRPVVLIGLMSYSLYLWHWPILSFVRIRLNVGDGDLPLSVALACLAGTFAVAFLSWRLIEIPFRRTRGLSSPTRPLAATVGSLLLTCSAGFAIVHSDGAASRFPQSKYPWLYDPYPHRRYEMTTDDVNTRGPINLGAEEAAPVGSQLLIWGDSHAMAAAPAFESLCDELGVKGAVIARSGTPPCFDVVQQRHGNDGNMHWCDAFKSVTSSNPVRGVALVARWSYYMDPSRPTVMVRRDAESPSGTTEQSAEALTRGLLATVEWLRSRNIKVLVVLEIPQQIGDPVAHYTWNLAQGNLPVFGVTQSEHQRCQLSVIEVMRALQAQNVTVIAGSARAFDQHGKSSLGDVQGPYYLDDDHVSPHGARKLLAPELRAWVEDLRESP